MTKINTNTKINSNNNPFDVFLNLDLLLKNCVRML